MAAPPDQTFTTQDITVERPPYTTIQFFDPAGNLYAHHDAIRPEPKTVRLHVPDEYAHHLPLTAKFTEHDPEAAGGTVDEDPTHEEIRAARIAAKSALEIAAAAAPAPEVA
jgi:hypothetical protein